MSRLLERTKAPAPFAAMPEVDYGIAHPSKSLEQKRSKQKEAAEFLPLHKKLPHPNPSVLP